MKYSSPMKYLRHVNYSSPNKYRTTSLSLKYSIEVMKMRFAPTLTHKCDICEIQVNCLILPLNIKVVWYLLGLEYFIGL